MTSEQVAAGYHPCVRHTDGYAPLLQAKMSTEGPGAIRCWDADGSARELPSEWEHTRVQMMFHVSHLWIMGSGFGLVVGVTDLRAVSEEPDEREVPVCPFPLD